MLNPHLTYHSPRLLLEVVNNVIIFIHNNEATSDDDHIAIGEIYAEIAGNLPLCRTLVITDGGAPTREQRKVAQQRYGAQLKGTPISLISDTATMRFIGATLTLVVRSMRVFTSKELGPALDFLGLRTSELGEVRQRLRALAGAVAADRFKTFGAMADREFAALARQRLPISGAAPR
jgi:hypothetical protein